MANEKPDFRFFYTIKPDSWFRTFPFKFDIVDENDGSTLTSFFLPIPPANYTQQIMSTSEAHATFGGVVEETSAPVFYMMTLVGNTGMALNNKNGGGSATGQRKTYGELTGGSGVAGTVLNSLEEATFNGIFPENRIPFQNDGSAVETGARDSKIEEFSDPNKDKGGQKSEGFWDEIFNQVKSTVSLNQKNDVPQIYMNGFSWDHALRQFFLIYKREKSVNSNLALYFVDSKSNTQYRCVPRSLQFQKTAGNPYVSQYNIILKCWKLEDAGGRAAAAINRFEGDLAEVFTPSITGIITAVSDATQAISRVANVGGALSAAEESFGSFI